MTIIYRARGQVRYSELSCSDCHRDNFVVSEDALDFYYESAPAQPYLCPTCRRRHDPNAVLYGDVRLRQAVPA